MSDVESDSSEDVQDLPEPKTIPSTGIFVLDHPVALVPAQQYWKIQEKLAKLTEENATLKRKLALANAGGSAGPGGGAAGSTNGAAGAAPAQRGRRSSSDHRQAKRRREESGERKNPSPEKPPPREMGEFQRREPSEMGDDPPMEMTAIQVVEYFGEIYNRKVASNVPLERKAALVQSKMTELNQLLGSSLAVSMLVPGKEDGGAAEERSVIPNQDFFRTRYGCVFKESGRGAFCYGGDQGKIHFASSRGPATRGNIPTTVMLVLKTITTETKNRTVSPPLNNNPQQCMTYPNNATKHPRRRPARANFQTILLRHASDTTRRSRNARPRPRTASPFNLREAGLPSRRARGADEAAHAELVGSLPLPEKQDSSHVDLPRPERGGGERETVQGQGFGGHSGEVDAGLGEEVLADAQNGVSAIPSDRGGGVKGGLSARVRLNVQHAVRLCGAGARGQWSVEHGVVEFDCVYVRLSVEHGPSNTNCTIIIGSEELT